MSVLQRFGGLINLIQPLITQFGQNVVEQSLMKAKGAEGTTDETLTALAIQEAIAQYPSVATDDKVKKLLSVMRKLPSDQRSKVTTTIGNRAQENRIEDVELDSHGKKTGKKTTTSTYQNPLGASLIKSLCECSGKKKMLEKMESLGMLDTPLKRVNDFVGNSLRGLNDSLHQQFGPNTEIAKASAKFLKDAKDQRLRNQEARRRRNEG